MNLNQYYLSDSDNYIRNDLVQYSEESSNITSDVVEWIPNGDFESWINDKIPANLDSSDFSQSYDSPERYNWYSENPWPVHEGNRSLGIQTRSLHPDHETYWAMEIPFRPTSRWKTTLNIDAQQNLNLSFLYWVDNNPDPIPGHDYLFVRLEFNFKSSQFSNSPRVLEYYLSGSRTESHYLAAKVFLVNDTLEQWNSVERNITADIESAGWIVDDYYQVLLTSVSFNAVSSGYTSEYVRGFLDDLRLANDTQQFIGGSTNNGNFESDSSWTHDTNTDISYVSRSDLAYSKSYSMNMTVASKGNLTQCVLRLSPSVRSSAANPSMFSVKWMLSKVASLTSESYSYVRSTYSNDSGSFSIYYMLCYGGSVSPFQNTSTDLVLHPPGFNSSGLWNNLESNFVNESIYYFNGDSWYVSEIKIVTYAISDGSSITCLIDQLSLRDYILKDGTYEDQGDVGDHIRGYGSNTWPTQEAYNPYFTVTDLSYEGSKALNLTTTADFSYEMMTRIGQSPINSTRTLHLDLMWRLERVSTEADKVVIIGVYFETRSFFYLLGGDTTVAKTPGIFLLNNTNTIGSWMHLKRDIGFDYSNLFGTTVDEKLLAFSIGASENTTLLLDNVFMYSTDIPVVSDVSYSTGEVGLPADIFANITDYEIEEMFIYYRVIEIVGLEVVNLTNWFVIEMNPYADELFHGQIPSHEHWTLIEFYLLVTDTQGSSVIRRATMFYPGLNTENFLLQFRDSLNPQITLLSPDDESTVNGVVGINISILETGSGLSHVQLLIDDVLTVNVTSWVVYYWDTLYEMDGGHTLRIRAFDNVGNIGEVIIHVTVDNWVSTTTTTATTSTESSPTSTIISSTGTSPTSTPTSTPSPSEITMVFLLGGVGVLAIVIVIILVKKR